MSAKEMIFHLLLERISFNKLDRVPETHLVMDDPRQVASFMESTDENGILVPIHFLHAVHGASMIRPGERVLELACGPANQLIRMARLNPDVQFIGLDASQNMLDMGRRTLQNSGLSNVGFIQSDMSRLSSIDDASIDCVICTMSLHHLPDLAALAGTYAEMRRVLKPGGGFYTADFGRLKRRASQHFFAHDRSAEQTPQFTQDYAESLAAAFSVEELKNAAGRVGMAFELYETILAPFMVILKTPDRRALDDAIKHRIVQMYHALTPLQQRDFHNIARWFQLAGYGLPLELN